jgi:hypothetical protein
MLTIVEDRCEKAPKIELDDPTEEAVTADADDDV